MEDGMGASCSIYVTRKAYRILFGNPKGKRIFGRLKKGVDGSKAIPLTGRGGP
jgi:hypothetical protein